MDQVIRLQNIQIDNVKVSRPLSWLQNNNSLIRFPVLSSKAMKKVNKEQHHQCNIPISGALSIQRNLLYL